MLKSLRIDYTLRAEVPIDEVKAAIAAFVAGIAAHHPGNLYTSYQHARDPRRFTHVGEFAEDQVASLQAQAFFPRFTAFLKERCEQAPEVTMLERVASTRDLERARPARLDR